MYQNGCKYFHKTQLNFLNVNIVDGKVITKVTVGPF